MTSCIFGPFLCCHLAPTVLNNLFVNNDVTTKNALSKGLYSTFVNRFGHFYIIELLPMTLEIEKLTFSNEMHKNIFKTKRNKKDLIFLSVALFDSRRPIYQYNEDDFVLSLDF